MYDANLILASLLFQELTPFKGTSLKIQEQPTKGKNTALVRSSNDKGKELATSPDIMPIPVLAPALDELQEPPEMMSPEVLAEFIKNVKSLPTTNILTPAPEGNEPEALLERLLETHSPQPSLNIPEVEAQALFKTFTRIPFEAFEDEELFNRFKLLCYMPFFSQPMRESMEEVIEELNSQRYKLLFTLGEQKQINADKQTYLGERIEAAKTLEEYKRGKGKLANLLSTKADLEKALEGVNKEIADLTSQVTKLQNRIQAITQSLSIPPASFGSKEKFIMSLSTDYTNYWKSFKTKIHMV